MSFYDPVRAAFVRDTMSRDSEDRPEIGETSTNRSFVALMEFALFLDERSHGTVDPWVARDGLLERTTAVLASLANKHFSRLTVDKNGIRRSSVNDVNMFTDSHLALAVAMLRERQEALAPNLNLTAGQLAEIYRLAAEIAADNAESVESWRGGKVHREDRIHDFVTLHAIRAHDAMSALGGAPHLWQKDLENRVQQDVLTQIAHHAAGVISQFDPAELAFSAVLLHRLSGPDCGPILTHSLNVIAAAQTPDGSWPTSRLLSYTNQRLLHVASFEIGLALVILLIRQLDQGQEQNIAALLEILRKTFSLVVNTFTSAAGREGWCNDRTRDPELVESWTTAIIVSFLQKYHSALQRVRQRLVLARYETRGGETASFAWPDLAPLTSQLNAIDTTPIDLIADPSENGDIRQRLKSHLVEPAGASKIRRPAPMSLLLTGPSEAQKRMAVRAVAASLGWPLVVITPADLVIGAQASPEGVVTAVFQDLMRLRRVVIFFDEFDHYFRRVTATSWAKMERGLLTAAAASILLGLQRLRQRSWTIQVCSVNGEIDMLEPDALRRDLFDFHQPYGNPTLGAQKRYVRSVMVEGAHEASVLENALTKWSGRDRAKDGEDLVDEMSFSQLDDLCRTMMALSIPLEESVVYAAVRSVARAGLPRLA
jgi:hypothetical protein